MEQFNQQEVFKKLFAKCVANPCAIAEEDAKILETGIADYPYCQVLNLCYSRSLSLSDSENLNKQVSYSSIIIPERKILYKILNEPEQLQENRKLNYVESVSLGEQDLEEEGVREIENSTDHTQETYNSFENKIELKVGTEKPDVQIIENDLIISIDENEYKSEIAVEFVEDKHPDTAVETIEITSENNSISGSEIDQEVIYSEFWEEKTESSPEKLAPSDQDTTDEIQENEIIPKTDNIVEEKSEELLVDVIYSEIDIVDLNKSEQSDENEEKDTITETGLEKSESFEDNIEVQSFLGDASNDINYPTESENDLKKDEAISDFEGTNQTEVNQDLVETLESSSKDSPNSENKDSKTDQDLSAYHDDKMPYSFLWWLQKTRMEHSSTYQPYTSFKLDTNQPIKISSVDQLSSQIIENIFHLQSPLEQDENAPRTVPFQVKRKEDSILEKFMKEEPQIRPPDSKKLDTENKARKSAEDPNDLVSETLAQIYADQMLYEKAISTYKKLSLKIPEKSPYFADRILELEKKVN